VRPRALRPAQRPGFEWQPPEEHDHVRPPRDPRGRAQGSLAVTPLAPRVRALVLSCGDWRSQPLSDRADSSLAGSEQSDRSRFDVNALLSCCWLAAGGPPAVARTLRRWWVGSLAGAPQAGSHSLTVGQSCWCPAAGGGPAVARTSQPSWCWCAASDRDVGGRVPQSNSTVSAAAG
jgi:hypothetical protein